MNNDDLDSKGDLIFQWMCANKSGRIDSLVESLCWFASLDNNYNAKAWLTAISSLGYCDLDWENRSWRILPSRLIRLPNADGILAYVGYRKDAWSSAVEDLDAFFEDQVEQQVVGTISLPQTIYFLIDANDQIPALSKALDAVYISNAASALANSLTALSSQCHQSRPPAFDTSLSKLEIQENACWVDQSSARSLQCDGVYRAQTASGKQFFEKSGDQWSRIPPSAIHFREFARLNQSPFEFIEDSSRSGMGDVYVPDFVNFPIAHLRTLIFCSGRVGDGKKLDKELRFANVPKSVLEKVSTTLMT